MSYLLCTKGWGSSLWWRPTALQLSHSYKDTPILFWGHGPQTQHNINRPRPRPEQRWGRRGRWRVQSCHGPRRLRARRRQRPMCCRRQAPPSQMYWGIWTDESPLSYSWQLSPSGAVSQCLLTWPESSWQKSCSVNSIQENWPVEKDTKTRESCEFDQYKKKKNRSYY